MPVVGHTFWLCSVCTVKWCFGQSHESGFEDPGFLGSFPLSSASLCGDSVLGALVLKPSLTASAAGLWV